MTTPKPFDIIGHQMDMLDTVKRLEEQNAELLAALRFYADVAIVEDDGGERARQAIAKAEGDTK